MPDMIVRLICHGGYLPISIYWNSEVLRFELLNLLRSSFTHANFDFEEITPASMIKIDGAPALRFFREPRFSRGFKSKVIFDVSKYNMNEMTGRQFDRLNEIDTLGANFEAQVFRVQL